MREGGSRTCWCGNTVFLPFGPEYGECRICGTLVSQKGLSITDLPVNDDAHDFYGNQYWLDHQMQDLGLPDIHARARNDLTDRNLHWLQVLLKYCLPPAKVLELGCSHGSFIAQLRQVGYDASGVEMSPWVVEFGRKTFGVPISVGPVETLEIPQGSLDVIVLMDVLEHLPDPASTVAYSLRLLNPDGLLLIQTPQFKEGMNYRELVEANARFLEMLIPEEHLYLFSERSVTRLFQGLGVEHIQFEPAIFDHYDMFFAVSRSPFQSHATEQIESALLSTPNGRFALALLDLREREQSLTHLLKESETDRKVKREQIEVLTRTLKESEFDRDARGVQIVDLTRMLKESESDRDARGVQIEVLTRMLKESEADMRALFSRLGFRWLNRISSWPEVKRLTERFGIPNG